MSALKPGKRFCDRLDGRRLREYRALDHDHGQRQRTGSFELGGGAGASRVFGDDQFDSMSLEQSALVGDVKRPARGDQLNTRRQLLRRGRLDAAHNIEVLWRCSEGRELHAPGGEKDAPRVLSDRRRCRFEALHHDPAVAIALGPRRAADGEELRSRDFSGLHSIRLHLHREGMGCVNEEIEALLGENVREPLGAAEAAREAATIARELGDPRVEPTQPSRPGRQIARVRSGVLPYRLGRRPGFCMPGRVDS